jgi:hypothetical protein
MASVISNLDTLNYQERLMLWAFIHGTAEHAALFRVFSPALHRTCSDERCQEPQCGASVVKNAQIPFCFLRERCAL